MCGAFPPYSHERQKRQRERERERLDFFSPPKKWISHVLTASFPSLPVFDEAAFKLALHLRHRHDMHGLARRGGEDARLMRSAWQRLDAELQAPRSTSEESLAPPVLL